MKLRILLLCAIMLPTLATAEIYKWKDKNGVVRYSDVPPPSNVKQEAFHGKKLNKPTGLPPLAEVEGNATAAMNKDKAAAAKARQGVKTGEEGASNKDEAAAKRGKDAETTKKADEAKQAELKVKEENCKISKSNLATYANGGRISKTNENGERSYLGDKDIAEGKVQAQKDVDKFCE
ncbi:MAG: DUF4124 domain-containing protein [Methylotenera sp.]|nr:DUF4124 domain-containing protein [Methylotenera sp.]NOT64515.1 DUF4124 domain-containing protein [Methylotenera sp.]